MYNLLLVDDEADTREALANYFPWQEVGFKVVGQAGHGKEALQMIGREYVDVVLTDIKMPVMDGIELARSLYSDNKGIHIIFLSAYREFEYAKQALNYRVKDYILKPAKYQELMEVFTRVKRELEGAHYHSSDHAESSNEGYIISKVKWYIRNRYQTANLEEAAQLVYLNPNYLSHLFKQKTGMNFVDYTTQVKMETAQKLLQDPKLKTYEVSEMVGYSNAKNFTRAFKRFCGMTPSEYRDRYLCHEA